MDALDTVMTALHNLQGIHWPSLLPEDQQPFLEAKEALRLWLAQATAPAVDAVPAGEVLPTGPDNCMWRSGHDGAGPDPSLFFCEVIGPAPNCERVRIVADTEADARRLAFAALSHGEGRK